MKKKWKRYPRDEVVIDAAGTIVQGPALTFAAAVEEDVEAAGVTVNVTHDHRTVSQRTANVLQNTLATTTTTTSSSTTTTTTIK